MTAGVSSVEPLSTRSISSFSCGYWSAKSESAVAAKAMEECLETLKKEGTSRGMLGSMQTRRELYDLIRYDAYERLDREIASEIRKGERRKR